MLGVAARMSAIRTNIDDNTKLFGLINEFCADQEAAVRILRALNWTCIEFNADESGPVLDTIKAGMVSLTIGDRVQTFDLFHCKVTNPINRKERYLCVSPPAESFARLGISLKVDRWILII